MAQANRSIPARLAATLVDPWEFARFVLTGVIATIGNLTMVWLIRGTSSYKAALLCGVATGFTISFVMSKTFAFRSREEFGLNGEMGRFLFVYGCGVLAYMGIGLIAGKVVLPHFLPQRWAELGGAFLGAGTMTFTSYFGHRFFTYRAHRREA